MRRARLACATLALAAACGEDESDYPTQVNPAYAALMVQQLVGIGAGVDQGSPDAAASGLLSLGSFAQNVITPVFEESDAEQLRLALAPAVVPLVGDCLCDAGGCQFDGCSDQAGSFTIDGSVQVSGDSYAFDVSIAQSSSFEGSSTENRITTSGEVSIGPTRIDGQVAGSLDTEVVYVDDDGDSTRVEGWFDWEMTARQIELDAQRCAVGGALDASVSAEAASGGRDVDYRGTGTVLFGPACGEAVVAPE